jgi:plasmid maintenance system antidote protein VapI
MPDVIRQAIKADGRSLYRLAKDSGVSDAVIVRFVNRQRDLNLRTADRLCHALGLSLHRDAETHKES